ncbi:secretin N-terminal domain-containing protein [Inquilinus sp. Marseille-Q2685]|uniref:secretin N-terminal domain-containing protein n=1 Tax=Inquilinus sp. Marseille-Q2685 TaxID=2866581 RepID=UPI001CE4AAF9|nr:secretin N-terminal domain-containing protein [Inquilinus sp. Marseille-Q2685]
MSDKTRQCTVALALAALLPQAAGSAAAQQPAPPAVVTAPPAPAPTVAATPVSPDLAAAENRRVLPWPDKPYPYVVLDQDVRDVLAAFGSNLDVPVKVSDTVSGRVRGRLPELTPQKLLDHPAASFGLQWYYDGQVLYVTTVEEAVSEMLPLGTIRFEELQASLASLRLDDPRFPPRPLASANVALVSGPPRYVALVKETMQALQQAYQFQTTIVRGRTGKPGS